MNLPTNPASNNPVTNLPKNQEDDALFDATEDGEMFTNSDGEYEVDDEAPREMEAGDIDLIEAACVLVQTATTSGNSNSVLAFLCEHLDKPSESTIEDRFSSVLGDAFPHQMKQPYVPIKHEYKKPYFVALVRAWFCWNEKKLKHVTDILRANDWMEDDTKRKMYYHPHFFQERIEQRVLPPSKLYWCIRAVYVKFGNKCDIKAGKPLFNKKAWKRVNSVMHEILHGEASDPPRFEFYTHSTTR
jgi:hypothetical protein